LPDRSDRRREQLRIEERLGGGVADELPAVAEVDLYVDVFDRLGAADEDRLDR
jgi:hypothetical protein